MGRSCVIVFVCIRLFLEMDLFVILYSISSYDLLLEGFHLEKPSLWKEWLWNKIARPWQVLTVKAAKMKWTHSSCWIFPYRKLEISDISGRSIIYWFSGYCILITWFYFMCFSDDDLNCHWNVVALIWSMNIFQVCAPSCHDCSTLRAWWEEEEERRQRYFKNVVGSDMSPPARCVPDIAHFIIRQHVEAPSMWAIFPLQVLWCILIVLLSTGFNTPWEVQCKISYTIIYNVIFYFGSFLFNFALYAMIRIC